MSQFLPLQCVECHHDMSFQVDTYACSNCSHTYVFQHGISVCWPKNMSEMSKEEIEYHDHFEDDAKEVHQLHAYRNVYYHQFLVSRLHTIPKGSTLLEIGAGTGEDAAHLLEKYRVILSDISPHTVERLKEQFGNKAHGYLAVDAIAIPMSDASLDAVYMVATFHHLVDQYDTAVKEFHRVLKPGGLLVFGVEPNACYFRWIKRLRSVLCKATHTHEHEGSHADAEMEGFTYGELKRYLASDQWKDIEIRPMWLLAGFLHYGLEFIYRALKLKKRIKFPQVLEKGIVHVDELLFRIPGVKHLGWHWNVVARKKD